MILPDFQPNPKMPRLSRECVITEKIDGTSSAIYISEDGKEFHAGSRNRWITPENDNYGFARWAQEHKEELLKLGPGWHRGEWWGAGIQRRYGLTEKRFSLFNSMRWHPAKIGDATVAGVNDVVVKDGVIVSSTPGPTCCHVVPKIYMGTFQQSAWELCISRLRLEGSFAAPGFKDPEGIVVWHEAAKIGFKKTIIGDEKGKAQQV